MAQIYTIEELVSTWEPQLREAFMHAVRQAVDRVNLTAIVRLLNQRDVQGVLRYVGLVPEDFTEFIRDMEGAFVDSGGATIDAIPVRRTPEGFQIALSFNPRNPRAEAWLEQESSNLVQEVVREQRVAIQAELSEGLQRGENPRTTALNLVGRINPQTKQREGGIIGLHSLHQQWVSNYAADLRSSDPAALRRLLDRGLRDKRFDRTVQKAIREGTGIPAAMQVKMRTSYANRVLKWRADNIARTETMRSLGAGQAEGYQQAIDKGVLKHQAIRRFWVTAGDARVRPDHRRIPRMNPSGRAWDEPFDTPTGPSMHAPHDYDINCRCHERVSINFFANRGRAA